MSNDLSPEERDYLAEFRAKADETRGLLVEAGRHINYLRTVLRELKPHVPPDAWRVGYDEQIAGIKEASAETKDCLPQEISEAIERKLIYAVQLADKDFDRLQATGSKHWVREFFLPKLGEQGLAIGFKQHVDRLIRLSQPPSDDQAKTITSLCDRLEKIHVLAIVNSRTTTNRLRKIADLSGGFAQPPVEPGAVQ